MKFLLLACCLVAGSLAGVPLHRGYVNNAGVQQAKATDGVRDWANQQNDAQHWAAEGQKYGRNAAGYDDASVRDTAKAQQTGSDYGSRGSNWDQAANAASRAANQASQSGYSDNHWADAADANKALKDQQWAQGKQWHQGRRNNDDLKYAYDKSFDLKDSENGGFELAESSNSHALDHLKDHAASYDRNVDKDAAWSSGADAAKANQKSAWGQNAAKGASSWDNFYRDSANAASANGRDKDWANKVDQSQGGHRLWSDARKAASDVYKDLATADGTYKRDNGYGKNAYGYGQSNPYGYGLAGEYGYAAKPGYNAPGYAGYGKGAEAAQAWDQTSKDGLRQWDSAASSDQTKAAFNRDQWLNDRNRGYDRDSKKAAKDKGASDWANQAAQSVNKADEAHAHSANAWNKDAAKSDFDENLWKKEAEKKRLSDRSQNKKVLKKWFNNKRHGGDNWERLNIDRDQSDDVFGYDTAAKKDWAQTSNANQWRSAADANGKKAWAAKEAAAANNAKQADWKKDAAGWQNANAASKASDAAKRQGWNNEQWKDNQASQASDARANNAQSWDRDANRANSAAAGTGYGAPKVGLGYGAYPGYNGYNAGYGYPANFGYGYPQNGYGYNNGYPANKGYGYNNGYKGYL